MRWQVIPLSSSTIVSFDTPLHVAVNAGHQDIVTILCERKAKLNLVNGKNETPLALANRSGKQIPKSTTHSLYKKKNINTHALLSRMRKSCKE